MILTLDRMVKIAASEVGDVNNERLPEIRRYVQRTVREITGLMRKGPVYDTATLSVASSEATLPDDVFAVLRVYDTNSTTFEQVDNETYRIRSINNTSMPTCQVFEDVPNWHIRLINYSDSTNTLNVDYLINSPDPAALPAYYEDLIINGVGAKYHLRHSMSNPEIYREWLTEYKRLINIFKENQHLNDKSQRRIKGMPEIELQDPANSLFATGSNAVVNARGVF